MAFPEKRYATIFLILLLALAVSVGRRAGADGVDPYSVAMRLAELGPRVAGSPAHRSAQEYLRGVMLEAGLEHVGALPGGGKGESEVRNLSGVLIGETAEEILLSAHYDSVAGSPGAGDDASGCGVVLAAAARLVGVPLRRSVRVLLFDGEERVLQGSRAWTTTLDARQRERLFADLNVEMVGWAGSAGPVLHTFPVELDGRLRVTPGWLVHAVLQASRAVDWRFHVGDPRVSILSQLISRTARLRLYADSDSLLEAGIPSLLLTDSSLSSFDPAYHSSRDGAERLDAERLGRWTDAVTSMVRTLDALSGKPRMDEEYLVAVGRVWSRRDLMWLGFVLWVVLVFQGRPGGWKNRAAEQRRRAGREYLPGFAFRILFLVAIFLIPALATVLLYPAAALLLLRLRFGWPRWVALAGGLAPAGIYLAALAFAYSRHFVRGVALSSVALLLLLGTLGLFAYLVRRPVRRPTDAAQPTS